MSQQLKALSLAAFIAWYRDGDRHSNTNFHHPGLMAISVVGLVSAPSGWTVAFVVVIWGGFVARYRGWIHSERARLTSDG